MSANSMNNTRDLYSEIVENVKFKLEQLIKDNPKFIEEKMPTFNKTELNKILNLKDSSDYEKYGSKDFLYEVDSVTDKYYEQLERKQLSAIITKLSKSLKKTINQTNLNKMTLPELRLKMMELSQEYDLVKIFSAQNKGKSGKSKKSKVSKESVRGKKKRTKKLGRKKRTYSKRK